MTENESWLSRILPNDFRHTVRAMLAVTEMTFRQTVMDAFIIFTVLVQPLIIAIMALYMLGDRGQDIAIFVVVGSGMTGLWSSLLFISGNSINVERWSGTLETLVGVPTPLSVIVIGKNISNVLQSLGSMIVSYLLAGFLFGYSLRIEQPFLFIISLAFTILAFISFALIIAPVFVMNPGVQSFQNALEFPIYILCGFLFPIALLPGWTTPLSYILPPYWAARALHLTSSGGGSLQQIVLCWGMMLLFSGIYLFISSRLFTRMIDKARTDATLDME
jgi:ABC-2 type transport system permease protein